MKKILIGSTLFISLIGATTIDLDKIEIDNTCDDLLDWIEVDLEEGRIDSTVFKSYTWNIKDIKRRNNEQKNSNR